MLHKRLVVATLALAMAALAACGGGSDDAKEGTEELTFLTPFGYILAYSDAMNAKSGGHFADEDLDVSFEAAQGSAQALTQVLAGKADIARTDAVDVLNAVTKNDAPLKVIASITQKTPFYVISGKDDPVPDVESMKGKTVGIISVGGATDNLLKVMLAQAGVATKDVNVQTVGSGAGSWGLIEQGKIDAFIDTSSSKVALETAGQPITAWNVGDVVKVPSQVYVVTDETLEKKPEALEAFLRAIRGSMREILDSDDRQALIDTMADEFEIGDLGKGEQSVKSLEADSSLWAAAGADQLLVNVPETWTGGIDLLKETGLVPDAPAPEDVYTDTIFTAAFGE
jgi:NitT/TauT family transport system substrate-binding protein